jgi:Ca2+-binding EF-hand superfamily protein
VITAGDFRELLSEIGFYSTDREIQGLVNRFDRDRDGVVSMVDWLDEFQPTMAH